MVLSVMEEVHVDFLQIKNMLKHWNLSCGQSKSCHSYSNGYSYIIKDMLVFSDGATFRLSTLVNQYKVQMWEVILLIGILGRWGGTIESTRHCGH
jgi:hypothetical protein